MNGFCGCGRPVIERDPARMGDLCPEGHLTIPFVPTPKWEKKRRCPETAHKGMLERRDDDGIVWWCEEGGHYATVWTPKAAIDHLSPSSISTARQCLNRFRGTYVLGRRETPGIEAVLGTFAHRVLEVLGEEPDGQRDFERARKLANAEWRTFREIPDFVGLELDSEKVRSFTAAAIAAVGRAIDLMPLDGTLIATEQRFELFLDGVKLHGVIDRVDRLERLTITDWKTGRPPLALDAPITDPYAATKRNEKLVQAHIYVAAASELYDTPRKEIDAQLLYIGPDTAFLIADPEDTYMVMAGVRDTWRRVKVAEEENVWPASPGPLCGWCPHLAWPNGDGTHDFCEEGLRFVFRKLDSRYGWTKYGTTDPVPAAVTIRNLSPEQHEKARAVAAECEEIYA